MTTTFVLNEEETEKAQLFLERHRHPDIYKGAIGGHINFIFTPTSVGEGCSIKCNLCGEEENLTDYSKW